MLVQVDERLTFILPDCYDRFGRPCATLEEWRLRNNFISAWGRIPRKDREKIASLWQRSGGATMQINALPESWLGCVSQGRKFEFAPILLEADDAIQVALSLHELAHAFDHADGKQYPNSGWRELMADLKADTWQPGSTMIWSGSLHLSGSRVVSAGPGPLTDAEIVRRQRPGGRYYGADYVPSSVDIMGPPQGAH